VNSPEQSRPQTKKGEETETLAIKPQGTDTDPIKVEDVEAASKPAERPAPLNLADAVGATKTELSTTVATIPTPLIANTTQGTIPN